MGDRVRRIILSGLVMGMLLFLSFFAGCSSTGRESAQAPVTPQEFAGWNLTINGSFQKILSLDEIRALPSVTGHGFAVSTVGIKFGPYTCKGVDLRDLATLVGGIRPGDELWVSAPDGYLWVFDSDQLEGRGFVTFNETLKEIPTPPLRIILMYEQDGKPLTYNDGGPCRIAIISEQRGVVTEGSAWVKWIDRIEVHRR